MLLLVADSENFTRFLVRPGSQIQISSLNVGEIGSIWEINRDIRVEIFWITELEVQLDFWSEPDLGAKFYLYFF